MNIKISTAEPDILTKPKIAPELLRELQPEISQEKQVIVHCCFPATSLSDMLIRIWPTTVLIAKESGHRSRLVHHENISLFPYWTMVPPHVDFWFTLVFTGLPSGCTSFELKEEIPEEGGFHVYNIRRNKSDIYRVRI